MSKFVEIISPYYAGQEYMDFNEDTVICNYTNETINNINVQKLFWTKVGSDELHCTLKSGNVHMPAEMIFTTEGKHKNLQLAWYVNGKLRRYGTLPICKITKHKKDFIIDLQSEDKLSIIGLKNRLFPAEIRAIISLKDTKLSRIRYHTQGIDVVIDEKSINIHNDNRNVELINIDSQVVNEEKEFIKFMN